MTATWKEVCAVVDSAITKYKLLESIKSFFYCLTASCHLEPVVDLDYFAVKVIVNEQWCVYYFTKVSRGRLPTKQSRVFVEKNRLQQKLISAKKKVM